MDDTQDLILTEMRLLRSDFNDFARDTGERVSSLETDMHGIIGNGQPGRMALMEQAVGTLKEFRWWLVGAAAGSGAVVSTFAWFVVEGKK